MSLVFTVVAGIIIAKAALLAVSFVIATVTAIIAELKYR